MLDGVVRIAEGYRAGRSPGLPRRRLRKDPVGQGLFSRVPALATSFARCPLRRLSKNPVGQGLPGRVPTLATSVHGGVAVACFPSTPTFLPTSGLA